MSDNPDAQPGGRFLALPKELRLLIYEQLFPPCKVDIHAPRKTSWVDDIDCYVERVDVALLATCRTMYAEAAPILYENTEFHIRLACSGPDLRLMKIEKHRVYAQLLRDLRGRVRSLFSQARKVSLSVLFTDSEMWEEPERQWFRDLTFELPELCEAPKLEQLHITLEVDEYSAVSRRLFPMINKEFEQVLAVLSVVESRAAVTVAAHPSLSFADVELSTYVDAIAKLPW